MGVKFGLDNVRTVLHELNDPHTFFPSIQIAGSNGKGSVSAMLSRIFTLHGWRCGLFTSPHLMRMEERIRINGEPISPDDFCVILNDIKMAVDALIARGSLAHPPTYFEIMTLAAMLYFKNKRIDAAVLEVGMGGRFDATTVANPEVTVITTISLEHERYLGKTLASIAREKAGIIKKNIPLISGVTEKEARDVIRKHAVSAGAPLKEVFLPESRFHQVRGKKHTFSFKWEGRTYQFTPSLPGRHQGRNAAVAAAAALEASRRIRILSRDLIIRGLENTIWEGRLEVIQEKPLVILDGAHNEEGALALRDYLQENVDRPVFLIFAVMKDKNISRLADILFPAAEKVYLTRFNFHRAASPEDVLHAVSGYSGRVECELNPGKALRSALQAAGEKGVIVAAGSLFLIGTIKNILRRIQAASKLPGNNI